MKRTGTRASPPMRVLLRHRHFKHWARTWYSLRSVWQLPRAARKGKGYETWWQAGKSVDGISAVEPAGDIVRRFARALG